MAYPTNPIYKLSKDIDGNVTVVNKATEMQEDGSYMKISIPFKEDNEDYQQYLKWAENNTAEAAD